MALPETVVGGDLGHLAHHEELHKAANHVVNVQDFMGPGISDSDAFESAAIAAQGKTLLIPPGTFTLPFRAHPESSTTYALLFVRTKTKVKGAGEGKTIIRLPNATSKPAGGTATSLIRNYAAGDEDIVFEDFTVDGNGGNQTLQAEQHQGIVINQARRIRFNRIHVKNLHGLGTAPDAPTVGDIETMGINLSLCSEVTHTDCRVTRDAGASSTGFGANGCTGLMYENCWAFGMSVAHGFANHKCRQVTHNGCHAYKNAWSGFNSEYSEEAIYNGCISGGRATPSADGLSHPFTSDEHLGNGRGFRMYSAKGFQLNGCSARYNTNHGAELLTSSTGQINSGRYTVNNIGIEADATSRPGIQIVGNPYLQLNTTANIRTDLATNYPPLGSPAYQPTVPASTVTVTNPYMLGATVYVKAGTVSDILVNGNALGIALSSGQVVSVRVPPRVAISITYTAAPTWVWQVG